MAIHKSVEKRARQNRVRNARNRALRSNLRTAVKKFRTLIETKDVDSAEAGLPALHSVIDRAVTKGILHKNTAARKKSRLTASLRKVQAA